MILSGKKINVLVTGASGQLGRAIKNNLLSNHNYNFFFKSKAELNISSYNSIKRICLNHKIDLIINSAAYTNVDDSEFCKEISNLVNNEYIKNIIKVCRELSIKLIHISTDYVFDGNKKKPYVENDEVNPLNNYGISKFNGEKQIVNSNLKNSIIIRTSWLYSNYGNNFVLNIINQLREGKEIKVTDNEVGSPTNADDLALLLIKLISKIENKKTEIYHFANIGYCSRYNFANEIVKLCNSNEKIKRKKSQNNFTKRPKFSALNSEKIMNKFGIEPKDWKISLNEYINKYGFNEI